MSRPDRNALPMNGPHSQPTQPLRCWVQAGLLAMMVATAHSQSLPPRVVGDAIPVPLTATPGDTNRGRAIVANRQVGLCLLCHAGPFPEERFQGSLAPDLSGAGLRWNEGQLRLRLVNSRHLNPESIMPAYFQTEGLHRVSAATQGRPLLDAQQIEDVVALLRTLK